MATIAQNFFATTTAHDITYGTIIDKLAETNPAGNVTTICDFGISGTKNIVCQPYTTNATDTTPMTDAALNIYGWAINQAGSDGMVSTSTAKRLIAAGTWSFQGALIAPLASVNAVTVKARVYRVAANGGTRTQLGSELSVNAGLVLAAGVNWSGTITDIGQVILEVDETIQVSFYLNGVGQIGGLTIVFQTGVGGLLNDFQIQAPSPGVRTLYISSLTGVLSFIGLLVKQVGKTLSGSASFISATIKKDINRQLSSSLSFASSLNRLSSKIFNATLNLGGNLAKQTNRAFAGAFSFSGSIVKTTNKSHTSALSFSAAAIKKDINRMLSSSLSFVGAINRLTSRALDASLSFSGNLVKRTNKALGGVLSFSGSINRLVLKNLTATLSFSTILNRSIFRAFVSTLNFVGGMTKQINRALSGIISFVGVRTDDAKTFTGTTKNRFGVALGSAIIKFFRTSSDIKLGQTISDSSGDYEFKVGSSLEHFAVGYKAGSPDLFGTTRNTIAGDTTGADIIMIDGTASSSSGIVIIIDD